MKKILILIFVLVLGQTAMAQEINATVSIDAQRTGKMQLSIFQDLQRNVENFINKTKWSKRRLPQGQRVNCSFFITVSEYSSNNFRATLQIQSSRPVYGSSMTTPVFNFRDTDFNFSYTEHQPLDFNSNTFKSNLVSTISFYVYVVLGLDADTFSPNGGADYFGTADQIAGIAQQSGRSGWSAGSGNTSRYELNRQLLSSNYREYHQALYLYHRKGLDLMSENVEEGKQNVAQAIKILEKVNRSRPNTILIRSFFDAKANEVARIFSDGPAMDTKELVKNLNDMAPSYSRKWSSIQ